VTEDPLATRLERLRVLMQAAGERAQRQDGRLPKPDPVIVTPPWLVGQPEDDPIPLETLIQGEIAEAGGTSCFVRYSVLPLGHRHGRFPLQSALDVDETSLRWLASPAEVCSPDLSGALFLDVETTGLAGGTGTLAFLVGAAWFEGDSLTIAQYLMRDPGEEPAVLQLLADVAANSRLVVTFNGRAFDVPLLATRYTLARRRSPFPEDHVDLLTPARRVWRLRLSSCRLANLEERVLGVIRSDDVPGWLVPQLYASYLRTGDGRHLSPVFDHNLLDVLSMVTLAGRLGGLHNRPQLALDDDPADLVALARCFERHGRGGSRGSEAADAGDNVEQCYREALRHGLAEPAAAIARMRLAALHKRRGQWDQAIELWSQVAAGCSEPWRRSSLIELAKWAEHQAKDYGRAITWAHRALEDGESCRAGAQVAAAVGARPPADGASEALRHRILRLQRKLGLAEDGLG